MRIGLNLLHARLEIGGAWNYIANLLDTLGAAEGEISYIAYCTRASADLVPDDPRFTRKLVNLSGRSQIWRIAYEQAVLPFIARRDGVDCLHWFANNGPLLNITPSVVTIYDMMFLDGQSRTPSGVSALKRAYLRMMIRHTCQNAEVLAPMSETTASVAYRLFHAERRRMVVIANPLSPDLHRSSFDACEGLRRKYGLPPQFWLYVAHPYPHKNHLRLLEAYSKFKQSTSSPWPLVLRGDREKGAESIDAAAADLGITSSIIWLPRLSPIEMATLYSAATALIFPSLYEGGGIPVLEAMACGCPVAASDIPTSREFAGDAALSFDANKVDDIVAAMLRLSSDPELLAQLAARGLNRARQYSRERVLEQILAAYRLGTRRAIGHAA